MTSDDSMKPGGQDSKSILGWLRSGIAWIFSGIVLSGVVFNAWQAYDARQELRLNREVARNQAFTAAMGQLSGSQPERIGGIYALEQLAEVVSL